MSPVKIDVFFPVPEGWGFCTACEVMLAQANLGKPPETRGFEEYPPEWQEDYQRLYTLVYDLADTYRDKVRILIWDPRSFQGLLKSIRHGVRHYPTFIIDGKSKITGWEIDQISRKIQAAEKSSQSEI